MGLRVLDCGANDGWMLANVWSADGLDIERCDGLELNAGAAERAQGRLKDRGIEGRVVCDDIHSAPGHFEPHSYDAVVMYEVLEHVPDPGATLDVLFKMCKPGGRVYISTPEGAFERGNVPGWNAVESKGHLRALRPHDVCELLCERGIIRDLALEQRLIVAATEPRAPKGRVVFYAGPVEALPEKILSEGLGGSETALCKMAEHFARRGYDVRVFAGEEAGPRGDHISTGEEKLTGQVLYAPWTAWDPDLEADLFISSRVPEAFDRTIRATRRVLWLHDADYGPRLSAERASRATDVVVLSDFQRDLLAEAYPFLAEHPGYRVSRNGIEASFYAADLPEKRPWVVYSSSPDRGLDVLLGCWPEIRKRVPEAELHTTYAPVYARFRDAYPHLREFHARLEKLYEAAEGVVSHGHMGQRELANLYRQAQVWAYPSWTSLDANGGSGPFPEIHCITAVEAQAAGAYPVCLDYGALRETVRDGKRLTLDTDEDGLSERWRERFIAAVVLALKERMEPSSRSWALTQDWSGVADEWEAWFLAAERPPVAA